MSERLEYGVELTWPDGSTEVYRRGTLLLAEQMTDWHNEPGNSICRARVFVRTITVGEWRCHAQPQAPLHLRRV